MVLLALARWCSHTELAFKSLDITFLNFAWLWRAREKRKDKGGLVDFAEPQKWGLLRERQIVLSYA